MSCQASRRCLAQVFIAPSSSNAIPTCLVPALSNACSSRSFSSSSRQRSRIGAASITVPGEVSLKIFDLPQPKVQARDSYKMPKSAVEVTGPLGKMTLQIPPFMNLDHNEAGRKATLTVEDENIKHQKAMWGTTRSHLQNYITGVSEGHVAILRLVGVGYRATVESTAITKTPEYPGQQFVSLKVGYSHPIELGLPPGVKASTPQPTRILLESINKAVVTQFAAEIREWRKPEPYKGKGIFVNEETIKLKAKKIK